MLGEILGSLGGGVLGGVMNLVGAKYQADRSNELADKANQFSERMSSSAYQRSVADMRAAGLNPALMYGSGGAESSPMAQMGEPPQMEGLAGSVSNSARTSMEVIQQLARLSADLGNVSADTGKKLAETAKVSSEIGNIPSAKASMDASARLSNNQADIAASDAALHKRIGELIEALVKPGEAHSAGSAIRKGIGTFLPGGLGEDVKALFRGPRPAVGQ